MLHIQLALCCMEYCISYTNTLIADEYPDILLLLLLVSNNIMNTLSSSRESYSELVSTEEFILTKRVWLDTT